MFDSPEELLRKIRLGEDSLLELKEVRFRGSRIVAPRRDALADELAAFANTTSGVVILGVDDTTREVRGIPLERLDAVEGLVRELLNDSIEPPLAARIVRLELPDRSGVPSPVLKVEIPRSLFVHKSPGGYFQRIRSSKRELRPEILARLFQHRSQAGLVRFEEFPVPGTSPSDLDEKLWRRFVRGARDEPESSLQKIGLLTRDPEGELRPTVAGVLLASQEPDRHLPGAMITAVCYGGNQRDGARQLDALEVRGPIDEQIRQAMVFLRRNQRVAATKAPYRIETPQFSERAVFEAIVNAVAHRDYSIHASRIRLFMFADRLELSSPGCPPNTVTVETLALRQATRNELITRLLSRLEVPESAGEVRRTYFLERRGDGVPIILQESEKLAERRPQYRLIDDTELLLTIFAAEPAASPPAASPPAASPPAASPPAAEPGSGSPGDPGAGAGGELA